VQAGVWPADDNPLCNAPHTASSVTSSEWAHPYSREIAAYPAEMRRREGGDHSRESLAAAPAVASKYWAPVRRVDQAFGDRNLVCACPPIEAFA
jgi:glycine dehydrogenase